MVKKKDSLPGQASIVSFFKRQPETPSTANHPSPSAQASAAKTPTVGGLKQSGELSTGPERKDGSPADEHKTGNTDSAARGTVFVTPERKTEKEDRSQASLPGIS
jgi:hypothetical protein